MESEVTGLWVGDKIREAKDYLVVSPIVLVMMVMVVVVIMMRF